MRTDDFRSSVLFCCLDLSGYLIWGGLPVSVKAVKVTDMGEVDIDILFSINTRRDATLLSHAAPHIFCVMKV